MRRQGPAQIRIDRDLFELLEQGAINKGVAVDAFVTGALKHYLWLREFRSLRRALMRESDRTYTDEEIFDLVS